MVRTVLPPNATPLEVALDTNNANRFDTLTAATRESSKTWSAFECPTELLHFLAWAFSVDTWNPEWSESVKRDVIASSVFVHRHKGTRAGIERALEALDLGASVSEWYEHGGAPYTFKVDVNLYNRPITHSEIKLIHETIVNTKNARSWLEALRVILSARLPRIISVIAKSGVRTIAAPPTPTSNLQSNINIIATASVRYVAGVTS